MDQLGVGFAYSLSNQLDLFVEPYYQDLSNRVVAEDRVNQTFSNSGDGRSYGGYGAYAPIREWLVCGY